MTKKLKIGDFVNKFESMKSIKYTEKEKYQDVKVKSENSRNL